MSVVRLILLTGLLSLFFACSNSDPNKAAGIPPSLQEFKEKEGDSKTSATDKLWSIPEPYTNLSIEQIKSQIEITDYMVMKGAATDAGTEDTDVEVSSKGISRSIVAGGGAVEKEAPGIPISGNVGIIRKNAYITENEAIIATFLFLFCFIT